MDFQPIFIIKLSQVGGFQVLTNRNAKPTWRKVLSTQASKDSHTQMSLKKKNKLTIKKTEQNMK